MSARSPADTRATGARGTQRRDTVLDLARFVSALAVLSFHHFFWGPLWEPGSQRYGWAPAVTRYGFLGVEVFFLISGFVILTSWERRPPLVFLRARFARLFPAWVVTVGLLGAVLLVREGVSRGLLARVAANLTMFHWVAGVPDLDAVYWSLAVEIRFYLFMVVIGVLVARRRLMAVLAVWLGVSLVSFWVRLPSGVVTMLNLRWAPLFVGGMAFADLRERGSKPWHAPLLAVAFLGSFAASRHHAGEVSKTTGLVHMNPWVVLAVVFGAYALFALVTVGTFDRVQVRAFTVLNAMSYPLYLVHQEIGFIGQARLFTVPAPVAEVLVVAAVLAFAWVVQAWVEPPLRRRLAPS